MTNGDPHVFRIGDFVTVDGVHGQVDLINIRKPGKPGTMYTPGQAIHAKDEFCYNVEMDSGDYKADVDENDISLVTRILEDMINTEIFEPVVDPDDHYVQLPEEQFMRDFLRIQGILLDLGYERKYIDLAYITNKAIRDPETHPDKTEVYFMLTDAELILNTQRYEVKKGFVVVISAGVTHQVNSATAQYLMANLRDSEPGGVAFRRLS